jgi:hypothetical protein
MMEEHLLREDLLAVKVLRARVKIDLVKIENPDARAKVILDLVGLDFSPLVFLLHGLDQVVGNLVSDGMHNVPGIVKTVSCLAVGP